MAGSAEIRSGTAHWLTVRFPKRNRGSYCANPLTRPCREAALTCCFCLERARLHGLLNSSWIDTSHRRVSEFAHRVHGRNSFTKSPAPAW